MLSDLITRFNQAPFWQQPIRVWGFELRATSFDRLLALGLHRLNVMGTEDRAILRSLIKPGMRIADIGANQGLYSLEMARLAGPAGEVLAFEPQPQLYTALKANLEANRAANVRTFPIALGAEPGRAMLQESAFNNGDNRIGEWGGGGRSFEVEICRLDDVLAENPVLDFIKMDVQGYEYQALQGMKHVFESSPNLIIYFEYWPKVLAEKAGSAVAVLQLLRDAGFKLHSFEGAKPVLSPEDPREANAVIQSKLPPSGYLNLLAARQPVAVA